MEEDRTMEELRARIRMREVSESLNIEILSSLHFSRGRRRATDPCFIILLVLMISIWMYKAKDNITSSDIESLLENSTEAIDPKSSPDSFIVFANNKTYEISSIYHKFLNGESTDPKKETKNYFVEEKCKIFIGIDVIDVSSDLITVLEIAKFLVPVLILAILLRRGCQISKILAMVGAIYLFILSEEDVFRLESNQSSQICFGCTSKNACLLLLYANEILCVIVLLYLISRANESMMQDVRSILSYIFLLILGAIILSVTSFAALVTQKIIEKYSDGCLRISSLYLLSFTCHYFRMIVAEAFIIFFRTSDKTEIPKKVILSIIAITRYHLGTIALAATIILPICLTMCDYSYIMFRIIRRSKHFSGFILIVVSLLNLSDYLVVVTSITREDMVPALGRAFVKITSDNRVQFCKIVVLQCIGYLCFTFPEALITHFEEQSASSSKTELDFVDLIDVLLRCFTCSKALQGLAFVNVCTSIFQARLIYKNSVTLH